MAAITTTVLVTPKAGSTPTVNYDMIDVVVRNLRLATYEDFDAVLESLRATYGMELKIDATRHAPVLVGRVLRHYHETRRVMSDVWDDFAVVDVMVDDDTRKTFDDGQWPEETLPTHEGFANDYSRWIDKPTAYHLTYWTVDATEEVWELEEAWKEEVGRKARVRGRADMLVKDVRRAIEEEARVSADHDAVVVKGRKIPVGTTVRVTFVGASSYGYGKYYAKVILPDGTVTTTDTSNLKVIRRLEERMASVLKAYNLPSELLGLLVAAGGEDGEFPWEVFVDAIADMDTGDYTGYEFAEAVRKIRL